MSRATKAVPSQIHNQKYPEKEASADFHGRKLNEEETQTRLTNAISKSAGERETKQQVLCKLGHYLLFFMIGEQSVLVLQATPSTWYSTWPRLSSVSTETAMPNCKCSGYIPTATQHWSSPCSYNSAFRVRSVHPPRGITKIPLLVCFNVFIQYLEFVALWGLILFCLFCFNQACFAYGKRVWTGNSSNRNKT